MYTTTGKKKSSFASGMGERSCPAGSLSMDAILAVLDVVGEDFPTIILEEPPNN